MVTRSEVGSGQRSGILNIFCVFFPNKIRGRKGFCSPKLWQNITNHFHNLFPLGGVLVKFHKALVCELNSNQALTCQATN